MISALAYLWFQSWKNRLTHRVRRLKQPKYLFGALFGAAYFYFYFFRYLFGFGLRGRHGMPSAGAMSPETALLLESVGALLLMLFMLASWVFPSQRAALVFSEAEIAFLLPAPVKRRTLVNYKLFKSQFAIFFTTLLLTLVAGRFGGIGSGWKRGLGWWLILSTLNLHAIGASFARTMLLEAGISNWKRRGVVLGLAGVICGAVAWWIWKELPAPPEAGDIRGVSDFEYYVDRVMRSGPLPYVLFPFKLVLKPFFATGAIEFLKVLWPVAIILALLYIWVIRSDVAFEEASVDASRRAAERVAAMRAGRQGGVVAPKKKKRAPFKLAATGWPPVALLWKNLIGAGQAFTLRFWLLILWVTVVIGFATRFSAKSGSIALVVGPICLGLLAMSFILGPQLMRQDFRQDLPSADVLKTYPLPSWQIALGELLAPVAILTGVQWCLLALAGLMAGAMDIEFLRIEDRVAYGIAVAVLAPVMNLVSLIIPNGAVLLFPGWLQTGKERLQGFEVMGQRLIFGIGQFVALLVALLPAAIMFALVFLLGRWMSISTGVMVPVSAVGAALIMGLEGALGLMLLGKLFERFDVSGEQTGS